MGPARSGASGVLTRDDPHGLDGGDDLIVAAVQMSSALGDRDANIAAARVLLRTVELGPGTVVCLPELWSIGHFGSLPVDPGFFDLAESADGATVSAMREVAATAGCAVVVPFFERTPRDEFYNSAAVLAPGGDLLGVYRKVHVAHSANGCEKFYMRAGSRLPVFSVFGWGIGVQICYDRDFPEPARALALGGADVLLYPTCTSVSMRDLWRAVLTTRAYENQVAVVGVGASGRDASGRYDLLGSSMAIGADGTLLGESRVDGSGVLCTRLTRTALQAARVRRFMRRDRRDDVYGAPGGAIGGGA